MDRENYPVSNFINCIVSWQLNHTEWDGHVVRTHKVHTASLKA